MLEQLVASAPASFDDAAEMRRANTDLLKAIDDRLGNDSSADREDAVLRELEPGIRDFLDRGAATGALIEEVRERTACQVLLDYWSSTLSHAGIRAARSRLAAFDVERLPHLADDKRPYVGLDPFRDGDFFFGRDTPIKSLLERVRNAPLVVVQGGSGSGKSSLVMGGALPALLAPDHQPPFRLVGPFSPGNAVLENLVDAVNASNAGEYMDRAGEASAMRANPARLSQMLGDSTTTPLLLVIDQFEEVFTLCNDGDRATTAAAIGALLQSCPVCRVILTLREEFSNELDKLEPLAPYLARHARFSMKEWPMGYDELRAAVERPAERVNLHFAPGIVDDLVKSVLGQDTALPLLQFALQALWKRRERNRITREIYDKVGSPLVALERKADSFYNGLSSENQQEVERILLELVRIDRLMEAYREPHMRSALLLTGTPRTSSMIELLAREDFLRVTPTIDGDATVEVKHEALLRNWPRYVKWISGKKEVVRQRLVVTESAQRWDTLGRSSTTDLLSAWQLHDARRFKGLSKLEQDYLDESEKHVDADRRARDWDKFIKIGLAAFVVVALIFLADGLLLLVRSQMDRDRSQVLEQFAGATESSYRGQVDDALTGALKAGVKMVTLPDKMQDGLRPQLREALLSTLRNATNLRRLFVVQQYGTVKDDITTNAVTFNAVAFHPTRTDNLAAFGGSNGWIYLASLARGRAPLPPTLNACVDDQGVSSLAFEREGRFLLVGCRGGKLLVWSTEDWHLIGSQRVSRNFIRSLSIRQDGRLVAATAGDKIALVQLDEKGEPSKESPTFTTGRSALGGTVQSLAFSPTGDTLLAGDGEGYILICRPADLKPWDCAYPQDYHAVPNDAILTLTYSPDGQQVAVGHYWRGIVDIWDTNFSPGSRKTIYHQSPSAVYSLAFFEACGRRQLAIATNSGLEYSPLDESAAGDKPVDYCARARWAQIGDQTYSVAFRDGLLAAATQAGYIAVLAPAGGEDPLRTRVPMRTNPASRDPIRGALLDEAESTVWLALQYNADPSNNVGVWTTASRPDPSHNVAILELSESGGKNILTFKVGKAKSEAGKQKIITRLAASRTPLSNGQTRRRLATIGCERLPNAEECPDDDYEVAVSEFGDRLDAPPTGLVLLTSPELLGRIPLRAVLSPDGQWLAISFKGNLPEKQLLFVPLDRPHELIWINSSVKRIKEIAFSEDSKTFAAGGCCGETGLDLIRLWSMDKAVWTPKETPKPLTLTALAQGVQDVTFAASTLVVGGRFGAIDLWEPRAEDATEVRVDTHGVSFVAFNRDTWLIGAASSQGVVRLWDTSSRPPFELTPAADDPAAPGFLAFAGNGARLISSADMIDVWDLDPASLQRKACALLRQLDANGINGDTPWHQNRECREGALTPAPGTYFQNVRNYLKRALAALGFMTTRS